MKFSISSYKAVIQIIFYKNKCLKTNNRYFFFSNIHINLFITFIEGKNSQNKEKRKKKNSFEKKKIFFTFSITYFFFPSHSLSLTPSVHIVQMLQLSIWMRKISHFRFVIKGSNYDSFASIRLLEDSVVLF